MELQNLIHFFSDLRRMKDAAEKVKMRVKYMKVVRRNWTEQYQRIINP
jgi:hypothetical protein